MGNKEFKNNAAELSDEILESVNGGLLVPVITGEAPTNRCVICGSIGLWEIDGKRYCAECKNKLAE